jgi:myo-inositol-1(or 4)-monophosphatase
MNQFIKWEEKILKKLQSHDWGSLLKEENRKLVTNIEKFDQRQIDLEVDNFLEGILSELADYPYISEEKLTDDIPETYWLVDPIDGTKEFAKGTHEFCSSIALIHKEKAVAGVIYNPTTFEYFTSQESHLTKQTFNLIKGGYYLISRSEFERGDYKKDKKRADKLIPLGSIAYKLGIASTGAKNINVISYRPKNSWDIAAGVAIINNRLNLPVKDHQGTEFIGFSPNKQVPNLLFETGFTV